MFTDASGNVPPSGGAVTQSGYLGYAATIQVAPAVQADASLVRDGTQAVAGSATGAAAFTPNPANGPAGFTGLITRVLNYALGTDAQAGVAQPAPASTGLGASGTLSASFAAPSDLGSFATAFVASQAQDSANATANLDTEQGVQTSLQAKVASTSGVSIDTEMSNMIALQTAYGASAKIVTAVQTLWADVLQMVN
jgi:flagellar hook-associated protein 1 FlgK